MSFPAYRIASGLTLGLILFLAQAAPAADQAAHGLSDARLAHAISERVNRVPEFEFIRNEAGRMGVSAYLFGGTAAAYAHYVRWDLDRETARNPDPGNRFNYDYGNIFSSTQDIDIVLDGDPGQAQALEQELSERFPHLQGQKSAWEVRLLRQTMGDKQALLGNPDFLDQNTDTNSTGLVELTVPRSGETEVRDLKDWNAKYPRFLQDVRRGEIHYYFSAAHDSTSFFKQGRNPRIISVIRFLTKAFQYDLKITPDDQALVKRIIGEFDPGGPDVQDSYVRNWLLRKDNGRKLFQNARNLERAWNTLEELGLRRKLIEIEKNPGQENSLAWWMSKEPLRSFPVGIDPATGLPGSGQTAQELGMDVVAHETNSFPVYESITRVNDGGPNVFISRTGGPGEEAIGGDGFYVNKGRLGGRNTGFTIRFHVDPQAREGIDFTRSASSIVFHNRNALCVILEDLDMSAVQLFKLIASGELASSDRGLLERLKLRILVGRVPISRADEKTISRLVRREFKKFPLAKFIDETWFALPFSPSYPEITRSYLKSGANHSSFVSHALTQVAWKTQQREWVDKYVQDGKADTEIAKHILSRPEWEGRTDMVETLMKRGKSDDAVIRYVLSRPIWRSRPEIIEKFLADGVWRRQALIIQHVLSQPEWRDRADILEKLIAQNQDTASIAIHVFSQPAWKNRPDLVKKLISSRQAGPTVAQYILSQPIWNDHPELVEKLIQQGSAFRPVAEFVLSQPAWKDHPELILNMIQAGTYESNDDWFLTKHVLSLPQWQSNSQLKALCNGKEVTSRNIRDALAAGKHLAPSSRDCIIEHLGLGPNGT